MYKDKIQKISGRAPPFECTQHLNPPNHISGYWPGWTAVNKISPDVARRAVSAIAERLLLPARCYASAVCPVCVRV